jgi:hypothetical protein
MVPKRKINKQNKNKMSNLALWMGGTIDFFKYKFWLAF